MAEQKKVKVCKKCSGFDVALLKGLVKVKDTSTGCIGLCRLEPIVEISAPGKEKVTYVNMDAAKAARIVDEHLVNGRIVAEYTIGESDK